MRKELKALLLSGVMVFGVLAVSAYGGSIVGTRHDLSFAAKQGGFHATFLTDYNEVCIYCHTPHGADMAGGPLWNRDQSNDITNVYNSATMDTSPLATPSTITQLCLSCHDGSTAPDVVHNRPNSMPPHATDTRMDAGGCGGCHDGGFAHDARASYLGTDLSDDHPVSMPFPDPIADPGFHTPPDAIKGWANVQLFEGLVECSSCHDVHDNTYVPFLVTSNSGRALCLVCHNK